jgi:hypothetical protein
MKKIAAIRKLLLIIPLLALAAVLSYGLPQVDVLRAVGVEIKRVDAGVNEAEQQRTRDVYQLQMETPNGQPRVYRNEDNFLFLKFDSASLQAQVKSLSADKQLVALRHYGIRIPLFSLFPNAVKVWPVEEGYRHIPVFNMLVIVGLSLLGFLGWRRVRRVSEARSEQRRVREAERVEDAEQRHNSELKKSSDIDDFLGTDSPEKD